MGLAWQQGPLAPGAIGHLLVPDPLPERLLYAEPLRRRIRVLFAGSWIADSTFAVSPAIGPIPPILVRLPPGDATTTRLYVPAAVRVAPLTRCWARRHLRRFYDFARLANRSAGRNAPMVERSAMPDGADPDLTFDEATPAPQR